MQSLPHTDPTRAQPHLTRRGAALFSFQPFLVVFLGASLCRAVVVLRAEVGADTVGRFAGGSVLWVLGGRVGLRLLTATGTALKACVFCVKVVLSKVWVLLHKTSEPVYKDHKGEPKTTLNPGV